MVFGWNVLGIPLYVRTRNSSGGRGVVCPVLTGTRLDCTSCPLLGSRAEGLVGDVTQTGLLARLFVGVTTDRRRRVAVWEFRCWRTLLLQAAQLWHCPGSGCDGAVSQSATCLKENSSERQGALGGRV